VDAGESEGAFRIAQVTRGIKVGRVELAAHTYKYGTGSVQPDPSALVVDLNNSPPGWGQAANLIVCLPGKWTTAWQAADQVAQAVATRG
jgi:hypothetical protein